MNSRLFCRRAGRLRVPAWRLVSSTCLGAALLLAIPSAQAATETDAGTAAEIRSSVGGKLKEFYRARGFWPLWISEGTVRPEADKLIVLLESADLDGLDPREYDPEGLRRMVDRARAGSPEVLAKAEMRLSRAFAAYVRDMRRVPSVRMAWLDKELIPVPPTEATALRMAALAPSLSDYLEKSGWMSPIYAQLRAGLVDYATQWGSLPELYIPPGPSLRQGAKGERVQMLRQRLGFTGRGIFDRALATRLRAFQTAHGMKADAIAGAGTIAALNRGPGYYERAIRINMERARVLPAIAKRHIVVDVASQRLWLYEEGVVVDTMKVIVGKPTEPTPMLAGMMRYAIINPYWNVPQDLVRRRIVPKVVEGGTTLDALGYEALSDWAANARVLNASEIDWDAVSAGSQELRVRQLPGSTNAMGKMKFMFPNDLGIYLHDTPEKELFKEDVRQFSSGCVRVEDAARLARWLFGKPLESGSDAPEQHVPLPQPVPVYLTYLTAAPTGTGIVFRDDTYSRDEGQLGQLAGR